VTALRLGSQRIYGLRLRGIAHLRTACGGARLFLWKLSNVLPLLWLNPCTSSDFSEMGCGPTPRWFCVTLRVPS
jgi:hypothetical protein